MVLLQCPARSRPISAITARVSGLMPVASVPALRASNASSPQRVEHGLGHLRAGAVVGAGEQDAGLGHAEMLRQAASGLVARMMALYMPGAASWVGFTLTSVSPAAVRPSVISETDRAPAMQPA